MGLAVAAIAATWLAAAFAVEKQQEYNGFFDKALYEYGVLINYIYTSKFNRHDDRASEFRVSIDDAVPAAVARHIRAAYTFLARVSGRAVIFDVGTKNVFDQSDRYVYVGRQAAGANPHAQQNPFVQKLSLSLERIFPNKTHDLFWKYQTASLTRFFGTPLLFNSEFASIDYKSVINERKTYDLKNTNIEKTAIYVNVPEIHGLKESELNEFIRYITIQEIFQEYNLAADVFSDGFKVKTILYDHDNILGQLNGAERIREQRRNVALGYCPYDVILTAQLYESGNEISPVPLGTLKFLYMYTKAYWYYFTSASELFDNRCWWRLS